MRLANAFTSTSSCQSRYANDGWQNQGSTTTIYTQLLSSGDGLKKVCGWLKDPAGNISVISPDSGNAGIDMDTIEFASGNPPQVVSFIMTNDSGGANQGTFSASTNDPLKMTWSVSDVEGLNNHPILLDYTTDGSNWIPIESAYGNLSSNPTTYSDSYYGFSAPTSSFFRVRIRVKDMAGNISTELASKAFNTSPWSVFAGSPGRGVGGSGKSALVFRPQVQYPNFAMNPINGDVYYIDGYQAIRKMSASTGLVSTFILHGSDNLGTSGTLTSSSRIQTNFAGLFFDSKGFLYLRRGRYLLDNGPSEEISRLNLATLEYTSYLGPGLGNTSGLDPHNVHVMPGNSFTFDESNTLYFLSSCTPGTPYVYGGSSTSTSVIMKVTQNADGTPGIVSRVAGNCNKGTPVSGISALSNPLINTTNDPWEISIAAWGNGRYIYYSDGAGGTFKIIDGITYDAGIDFDLGGVYYDRVANQLIVAADNVKFYAPSISPGDNGEALLLQITNSGTLSNCADEGTPYNQACGRFFSGTMSSSGKFFFIDGYDGALSRLRYLDDNGNLQTLVGARSFSGDGQRPDNARGDFGGINYKKATDPLTSTFPEGLYFLERYSAIFGYFTPTLTNRVVGNKSCSGVTYNTPRTSSDSLGYCTSQNIGALSAFAFDDQGRPWYRMENAINMIDGTKSIISLTQNQYDYWIRAIAGVNDPRNYNLYPYGFWQNMTIKGHGKIFVMGSWSDPYQFSDDRGKIRIFDFENNVIRHVMGDVAKGITPDQVSEGSLENQPLNCQDNWCAIQYDTSSDRLYLAEENRIRYITNPEDPTHHTLRTVFTFRSPNWIMNFSISPNKKYIMYVLDNGHLYCHAVSAVDNSAICNNDPNLHADLGPPAGLTGIVKGPNQMTWKDDTTLYLSTYQGEIYEYILHH